MSDRSASKSVESPAASTSRLQPLLLGADAYVGPAAHERDRAAIHRRSWQYFGLEADFREPGRYRAGTVADAPVLVVRGDDGVLRGFYNVCRHRGHRLVEGEGRCRALACPYHAWTYDLAGAATGIRGAPEALRGSGIRLQEVRVDTLCGLVWINLDPEAAPMAREFAGLDADLRAAIPGLARLRFARQLVYEIRGNWKAAVDNVLECYHCPVAHPAFCELVDMPRYEVRLHERWSRHVGPANPSLSATPYDTVADRSLATDGISYRDDYLAWFVWPNAMLNRFPGRDNLEVIHVVPTGPDSVRQVHDFYFVDGTASAAEDEAIRYIDTVLQPEDNALVESVQSGYRSGGYDTGWYVLHPERQDLTEKALRHFHSLVVEAHAALGSADPAHPVPSERAR